MNKQFNDDDLVWTDEIIHLVSDLVRVEHTLGLTPKTDPSEKDIPIYLVKVKGDDFRIANESLVTVIELFLYAESFQQSDILSIKKLKRK